MISPELGGDSLEGPRRPIIELMGQGNAGGSGAGRSEVFRSKERYGSGGEPSEEESKKWPL